MGTKRTRDVPARLEGVRRRFERWRRTRKVRSQIPDALWTAAVKLAGTYGVHRTARALRLDYYALKKRVEQKAAIADTQRQTAVTASNVPPRGAGATFLELAPLTRPGYCECTLELEDAER